LRSVGYQTETFSEHKGAIFGIELIPITYLITRKNKMAAAKPSKATITNALSAIMSAGLVPGVVHIASDGSFRVDVDNVNLDQGVGNSKDVQEVEPRTFGQKR
jgi:hypothetical protein